MKYRVDNIPLYLKPFFYLFAVLTSLLFLASMLFVKYTCRIRKSGTEHIASVDNAIYTIWHENLLSYFAIYFRYQKPYAWINHPLWYMKPVHLALWYMGNKKLILGSSGHDGKKALNDLIPLLKEGYNTLVACDGPAGPPKVMKNGVLDMSCLSDISVIPIEFQASNYFRLGGWDQKQIPIPFSTIKVIYHKPVLVTEENYEDARVLLSSGMGK